MPPLGTVLPDHDAVDMVTQWVVEDLADEASN
jgi:hypothetical protein